MGAPDPEGPPGSRRNGIWEGGEGPGRGDTDLLTPEDPDSSMGSGRTPEGAGEAGMPVPVMTC